MTSTPFWLFYSIILASLVSLNLDSLNIYLFTSKFELHGYSTEYTPTESSTGGALSYISNRYSYHLRNDFNQCMYMSKSLESVFVEIHFLKKKPM